MKKKILAIIPARGGSQRIKNKNLTKINGHPLIYYTLKYAKDSGLCDMIFVSTDDIKISNYVKKLGFSVPFLRPKKIANSKTSDEPVLKHVCDTLERKKIFYPEIIIFLRPTTPFRKKSLIKKLLNSYFKNRATSVRSARKVGHWHPFWMYQQTKKRKLKEVIPNKNFFKYYQSQMLPDYLKHDGYCDIIDRKNLISKNKKRGLYNMFGNNMIYELNDDDYFINIDDYKDLKLARLVKKIIKKDVRY
jgi:CMP-N,N'-diacetyllegionaminic acid synthase